MGRKSAYIDSLEELVLLALMQLGETYGVPLRELIEERTGRKLSIGAVYAALDRLEQKAYVQMRRGEPLAQRGGRAKLYFRIDAAGIEALNNAQRDREAVAPDALASLGVARGAA